MLMLDYLPITSETFKAFKLLNPKNRHMHKNLSLFRDVLVKSFLPCMGIEKKDIIINEFEEYSLLKNEELPISILECESKDGIEIENYWFKVFTKKETKFLNLSKFFLNLMTIPQSNTFVERIFSQVSNVKTEKRNLLDITTMSSIIKLKSYYIDSDEQFEPNEEHYSTYSNFIKKIKFVYFFLNSLYNFIDFFYIL